MKNLIASFLFSIVTFFLTPLSADGHEHPKDMLKAENAWARPTIGNSKNGVAYVVLKNTGTKDILITSGKAEVSERLELHTHIHEDGIMKMRPVKDGIKVPAGGMTELKPGGLHMMLMNIKKPLLSGETFTVQLNTASGMTQSLEVQVRDGMKKMDQKDHHEGHGKKHH